MSGTTFNSSHNFRKLFASRKTSACQYFTSKSVTANDVESFFNLSVFLHNKIPTSSNVSRIAVKRNDISLEKLQNRK